MFLLKKWKDSPHYKRTICLLQYLYTNLTKILVKDNPISNEYLYREPNYANIL